MQQPSKIIIADTSCFILLDKIASLYILFELFGEVTTTREVQNEFSKQLPEWVRIEIVKDTRQQVILEAQIDKGEASAIALAIERANSLLILDDLKARKLATKGSRSRKSFTMSTRFWSPRWQELHYGNACLSSDPICRFFQIPGTYLQHTPCST